VWRSCRRNPVALEPKWDALRTSQAHAPSPQIVCTIYDTTAPTAQHQVTLPSGRRYHTSHSETDAVKASENRTARAGHVAATSHNASCNGIKDMLSPPELRTAAGARPVMVTGGGDFSVTTGNRKQLPGASSLFSRSVGRRRQQEAAARRVFPPLPFSR
jgi:hypothetical protein